MQPRRHFAGWIFAAVLTLAAICCDPATSRLASLLLLCWFPGAAVVRLIGADRRGDIVGETIVSVALSLALVPLVLDLFWRHTNDGRFIVGALGTCLVMLGAIADFRLSRTRPGAAPLPEPLFESTGQWLIIGAAAAIVVFSTVGTYWPDEANGAPVPTQIHDYIKHHAVLYSLQQRPLPLGNPFFADQATEPCYYYHLFYLIPATIRGGWLGIALAYGLHSALVALSTAGLCALLARRLSGSGACAALTFVLATVVGGIDIVPLLIQRKPAITLDAWADTLVRIHNLLTQMVWTPQNVQGLLVALVGAWLLSEKGWWKGWLWLGPMLGASLVGSSVWVSCAVMPGLALWVVFGLWEVRGEGRAMLRRLAGSVWVAAAMLALAAPSLLGYTEMSRRLGKSLTMEWPEHQANALLGRMVSPGILANLLDLPWIFLVEFGALLVFPLLLPRELWRRAWQNPGTRILLLSTAVALAGFVSVRSHFTYNDFGQKIVLVALATGTVLGGCVLATGAQIEAMSDLRKGLPRAGAFLPRGRWRATIAAALIVLGAPVGLYQSPIAAIRRFLSDAGPLRVFAYTPAVRARQEAPALRYLRDELPLDAVVQAHWGEERLDLQQMIHRQIGVMILEQDTHVFTGHDRTLQQQALEEVAAALGQPCEPVECHAVLRRHGITHVFVGQVEREKWQALEKLEDASYFQCVLRSGEQAVYRLR